MIWIVPMQYEDWRFLLHCRNKPEIYGYGRTKKEVTYQEHISWVNEVLNNPEIMRVFVVVQFRTRVGMVRFAKIEDAADVSVYIHPAFWGRGIAPKALTIACEHITSEWPVNEIIAQIDKGNLRSVKAFERADFYHIADAKKNYAVYQWMPEPEDLEAERPFARA